MPAPTKLLQSRSKCSALSSDAPAAAARPDKRYDPAIWSPTFGFLEGDGVFLATVCQAWHHCCLDVLCCISSGSGGGGSHGKDGAWRSQQQPRKWLVTAPRSLLTSTARLQWHLADGCDGLKALSNVILYYDGPEGGTSQVESAGDGDCGVSARATGGSAADVDDVDDDNDSL